MLQDLLWLYGAKRQYEIQKEAGLAGLIALVSTFFIIWQWDNLFYPFFEAIGLIHLVSESGLIGGTIRETIINISATFLFFIFAIGLAIALPMLVLMIILSLVTSNNERPNPILFALSLVLLPIMLVIYFIYRILRAAGLIKKSRPQTVQQFARQNSTIKSTAKGSNNKKQPVEVQYLQLFLKQEAEQGITNTYVEVSQEDAKKTLNRAISSLHENTEYLFGFDERYNHWYLLLPNPIPVFASETILDKRPEVTPFNFEKLSLAHLRCSTGYKYAQKPVFYVPAMPLNFVFDPTTQHISMAPVANHNGYIVGVDNLAKFVKVNSKAAQKVYEVIANNKGIQSSVKKAHAYAYTIPLAYPIEVHHFNDSSCTFSYYKALQDVPNASELCEFYKDDVLDLLRQKGASGHLWARELVKQAKEKKHRIDYLGGN